MSGPERIAENPAPYNILTARDALSTAAALNKGAWELMEKAGGMESEKDGMALIATAAHWAQIAQSFSTYALALTRWSTS